MRRTKPLSSTPTPPASPLLRQLFATLADGSLTKATTMTKSALPDPIDRPTAVAMIVVARFLAGRHPTFAGYVKSSYRAALDAGMAERDLALLKTVLGSIGAA